MFPDSTKQPVNRDAETELNHVIQFSNSSEKSIASTSKRHLNSAKDSANSSPELSSRWVKRLKSDYSNSVGNGPHSLEIHNLFSRALKSKRAKPISVNFFEEEAVFVKEKQLPKTGQGSLGVSMKDMKCWIKRWSRNNSQIILDKERMVTTTMNDGEETTAVSEKCEARKYPSTAATEMTRNAKNKLRSCEFQRRGTSVVWNTGGF